MSGKKHQARTELTRRKTLKAVGAGFALSAVPSIGQPKQTTSIVTVKSGEDVLESKKVSKRWWNQMQQAKKAREKVSKGYLDRPGVESVSLGVQDSLIDGRKKGEVIITHDRSVPKAIPQKKLPEQVDGVSIRHRPAEELTLEVCNTGDYSNVPGGVVMGTRDTSCCDGAVGTTGCRVLDANDNNAERLITAGHNFNICEDPDPVGRKAYQSGQEMGVLEFFDSPRDFAIIKQHSGSEVNGFDNSVADAPGEIRGRVTESGVQDLMSNVTTIYKVGRSTCKTDSVVTSMYERGGLDKCNAYNYQYIHTNLTTSTGDSGSPVFVEKVDPFTNEDFIAMIAIHHGSASSYASHSSAYDIYDNFSDEFR